MAESVGAIALDIVMGKNTVTSTVKNAMAECQKVISDSQAGIAKKLDAVGTAVSATGAAVLPASTAVAGLGATCVKTAADFETSMSQVAATMGMTAEEVNNGSESYERLEAAARDMGSKTKYSASEAAEALNYLALAGYDADKSISTLPTVLNLACAGGIDLASASDMVTDAMSALGDTAGTCEEFVDKMAKTSQKSNTSVAQLGEAILTVGGTAKTMAGGTTELNTCLGILADNGIKGAEGGTALRNIILSLSAPTDTAAEKMAELGLQVYDAEGNMRPLNDVFNDLNDIMSTMTQGEQTDVLNTIFNKVDLKSANALLANSNERFNELSALIDESNGAASAMADTMNNNLNGQLTALKSALSEAAISLGQALLPVIKDAVSLISNWTAAFNGLSDEQKKTIVVIGGVVAAAGPVLIVTGKVISGVSKVIGVLKMLFAVVAANPIILVIGAIIAAGVLLVTHWEEVKQIAGTVWGAITDFAKGCADAIGEFFSAIPAFLSGVWDSIGNAASSAWSAISDGICSLVSGIVSSVSGFFTGLSDALGGIWQGIQSIAGGYWELIKNVVLGPVLILCDLVTGDFGSLASDLSGIWNNIKNAAGEIWGGIKDVCTGLFDSTVSIVTNTANALHSAISSIWENMKNFATTAWENIKTTVTTTAENLKTNVVNAFNGMKESIKTTVTQIPGVIKNGFSEAISFITALPGQAIGWGKDMIQGIIDGITGMIGSVKDAVGNVADTIRSFLHFSVPDEGPLTDYESWMPDFMSELASGIYDSMPLIEDAVNDVAGNMQLGIKAPKLNGVGNGNQASNDANILQQILELIKTLQKDDKDGNNISIPIYLDGRIIDEYLINSNNRKLLRSGGVV